MGAGLDSTYSWIRLTVSLAIAIVGNVGMWAVIVVLPLVGQEFGIDRADASLPYVATMMGFALGNFAIGTIVDRYGMWRALIGTGLLSAIGYGLAAMAPNVGLLSIVQFFIGFATAASFGPLIADISHWFLRRRGIAVALVASGNYLSGAVWPLALAGVLEASGWRAAYLVLAVATLVVVLPLSLLLRRKLPEAATAAASAAQSLRARDTGLSPQMLTILLCLAGLGCCVAMSMPQVHIVALCMDLGYGPAVGAEMLTLMLLGGVASRIVSGLLADRLGGVWTLLIGSTLQMLALMLYLPAGGLTSLYVVSMIFGLSQGGIVPSYAIIVREYLPAKEAGARVGLVLMMTIFGMALGGWLSGLIYDLSGSYRLAFINGIAFNLLNIAVMVLILSRSRPGTAVPAQ